MGKGLWKNHKELVRDQKFLAKFGAKGLDSRGGVQNVAVVGHFAAEISDFGRDHFAAMGARFEFGPNAVLAQESMLCFFKAFCKIEEQVDGTRLLFAEGRFPRDKGAVAGNLVNLAAVFFAAVGKQLVVVLQEVAVRDMPEFFCDSGGTAEVDEHENEFFFPRVLVLAQQRVHEDAASEFLVHRADECNEMGYQEQLDYQSLVFGLLEHFEYVLQAIFRNEGPAIVGCPK